MKQYLALFVIIIHSILAFGQKRAMTYEEANPGVLKVVLNVSSDTAHLESLIGKFNQKDVAHLKAFLSNREMLQLQEDSIKTNDEQVETLLRNVLKRKVDQCHIIASDTSYAVFNTDLENEVIRPLILWVKKYGSMCQMVRRVWGLDEAKRKLEMKKNKERQ